MADAPTPGTLYVVATPIGHLGDMTERAITTLRSVAVVAAEDTRVTRKLWSRFDIGTPLLSFHAQSDERRLAAQGDQAFQSCAGEAHVEIDAGNLLACVERNRAGQTALAQVQR